MLQIKMGKFASEKRVTGIIWFKHIYVCKLSYAILNDESYYSKSNINPEMELQLKHKRFLQKYKVI